MSEARSNMPNPPPTEMTNLNVKDGDNFEVPVLRDDCFARLVPTLISVWQETGLIPNYDVLLLRPETRETTHVFSGVPGGSVEPGKDYSGISLKEKKSIFEVREIGRISLALPAAISLYEQLRVFFLQLPPDAFTRANIKRPQGLGER